MVVVLARVEAAVDVPEVVKSLGPKLPDESLPFEDELLSRVLVLVLNSMVADVT